MSRIEIRKMQPSDLDFCEELRAVVHWNQRRSDWALFLRLAPDGCFIAEVNRRAAGSVTTIQYEQKIGWIGMLIVHPKYRGTGIGTRLLETAIEHLRRQNVTTIKLDATPQGEPLYARMGFQSEVKITRWIAPPRPLGAPPSRLIQTLNRDEFEEMIELDMEAFGARREQLLRGMEEEAIQTVAGRIKDRTMSVAMLRKGETADYLGPVVASRAEDAQALILAATRTARGSVLWDSPALPERDEIARQLGFTPQRTLTRMRFGPQTPGKLEKYWGLADPACG